MEKSSKHNKILDALQELLEDQEIQKISMNDIANRAGIGKSSIYYYFPSKDAIIDSLIERDYKKSLETATSLAKEIEMSPFTRMSMIFQACRKSSTEFLSQNKTKIIGKNLSKSPQDQALIHQKYLKYIITELKPVLTEIMKQGIANGEMEFDYPEQLAEICLIVLSVKLNNTLLPSTPFEIEQMIRAWIKLFQKGTNAPVGCLDYMINIYLET